MGNIRTFVAVLIDDDLKRKVGDVQNEIRKLAPDVKWVAVDNIHVTMKFLGDLREDDIGSVCDAVEDAAKKSPPFSITISGLGAFPSPARARVVWVGITSGVEQLAKLADDVDANLSRLGFEKETRPFKAHITIGRVKEGRSPGRLAEGIETIGAIELGTQKVASIAVMQSDLRRDGPVYSPLKVIELSGNV